MLYKGRGHVLQDNGEMLFKRRGECSTRKRSCSTREGHICYKTREVTLQGEGAFFTTEWDILYKRRGHVLQGEGACSREQGIVYKVMGECSGHTFPGFLGPVFSPVSYHVTSPLSLDT